MPSTALLVPPIGSIAVHINGYLPPDTIGLTEDGELMATSRDVVDRFLAWYNAHVVRTIPPFVLLDDGRIVEWTELHTLEPLDRIRFFPKVLPSMKWRQSPIWMLPPPKL